MMVRLHAALYTGIVCSMLCHTQPCSSQPHLRVCNNVTGEFIVAPPLCNVESCQACRLGGGLTSRDQTRTRA